MARISSKHDHEDHARILRAQQSNRLAEAKSSELYEAHWLLSGSIGSPIWVTKIPNSTETLTIDFQSRLPDGSRLSDPPNEKLLTTIQKYAFHLRLGKFTESKISHKRWEYRVNALKPLCSWLTLNKEIYHPKKFGFMLLDQNACESYLRQVSEGGYSSALQYKERFIAYMHKKLNHSCSLQTLLENPNQLNADFLAEAIAWLTNNKMYTPGSLDGNWSSSTVSRKFLGEVLGASSSSTSNCVNFRHFIRQFEPKLADDQLLIAATRRTLYPSQNVVKLNEAADHTIGQSAFKDQVQLLTSFLKCHSTLPTEIPNIQLNVKAVMVEALAHLKRAGHTNLIPLTIGMKALNEACHWVLTYGEAIVTALIHHIPNFVEIDKTSSLSKQSVKKQQEFKESFGQWVTNSTDGSPPRKLIEALNIQKLQQKTTAHVTPGITNFRAVMDTFIGACAILVGILKPIRNKEIRDLKRNCVAISGSTGGLLLNHFSGKSGTIGINDLVNRPIPSIAGRAIQLLQLLGNNLSRAYGDETPHSEDLFYFPGHGFKKPASKYLSNRINKCIDQFCDMIETPVDKDGRRWYVRTHEMRKFFLLIMHRHEGESSSILLGYAASHVDRDHIDEYTSYHADYDEYLRYESECVEDKLIAFEVGKLKKEGQQGLAALYDHTMKHFGVTSLYSVQQADYLDLVIELRKNNRLETTTFSINLENYDGEVLTIDFAIRFGDKKDEKFSS